MNSTILDRPKFDRKATIEPKYLNRLRNKGWWRMVDYITLTTPLEDSWYYRSQAFHYSYSKGGGVFLDAGCGDSPDALLASFSFKKCYKVDLFPPSSTNNIWEKKFKRAEGDKVTFIQGDVCERLPIRAASVDLISCSAVLDLIPPDDRILFYKEAYRMLKPGGRLSISIVGLVNGYGTDPIWERDVLTMPGWGVNFKMVNAQGNCILVEK